MWLPARGPLTLKRMESVPSDSEANAMWSIRWSEGQLMFGNWPLAVEWLTQRLADAEVEDDAVLFAGPFGCPWRLDLYIEAAGRALRGNREGVFDSYARSAVMLIEEDGSFHDRLTAPWRTNA